MADCTKSTRDLLSCACTLSSEKAVAKRGFDASTFDLIAAYNDGKDVDGWSQLMADATQAIAAAVAKAKDIVVPARQLGIHKRIAAGIAGVTVDVHSATIGKVKLDPFTDNRGNPLQFNARMLPDGVMIGKGDAIMPVLLNLSFPEAYISMGAHAWLKPFPSHTYNAGNTLTCSGTILLMVPMNSKTHQVSPDAIVADVCINSQGLPGFYNHALGSLFGRVASYLSEFTPWVETAASYIGSAIRDGVRSELLKMFPTLPPTSLTLLVAMEEAAKAAMKAPPTAASTYAAPRPASTVTLSGAQEHVFQALSTMQDVHTVSMSCTQGACTAHMSVGGAPVSGK